jgi:hypothetical protein
MIENRVLALAVSAFVGPIVDTRKVISNTVRSESRCALMLRYVDLVVSIEVAVEECFCFTVFSF